MQDDLPRFFLTVCQFFFVIFHLGNNLEKIGHSNGFHLVYNSLCITLVGKYSCHLIFEAISFPSQQAHTSKINVLCSSLNSEETLQNFPYLYKKKTQVVFFVFHFEQLSFSPYE